MKRCLGFFLSLLAATAVALTTPSLALAQAVGPQEWSDRYCVMDGVATIQGLQCLIGNVFSVAITFIGLAAFVMLIIGAFGYLLSGGNSKGTETARNTITFAVIGIVVALSAFIILNFVSVFTGVEEITNFAIPESGNGQLLSPESDNRNLIEDCINQGNDPEDCNSRFD
jgi:hypothetical protein